MCQWGVAMMYRTTGHNGPSTIGATVGIVMCQWGVAMVYRTSGHKGQSPQRHKPTKECQRVAPSSSQPSPAIWGNQCGSDDRDWHTHNLTATIVPQEGRTTIGTCCVPGPDIATVWACPTPVYTQAMHKQHTEPGPSCCVCPSATHMSTK